MAIIQKLFKILIYFLLEVGNIYVYKCTQNKLNWLRIGTVIGADVHTRFPPTQTLFLPQIYAFSTCIFIYLNLYIWGKRKFISLQTSYLTLIHTL